MSSATTAILFKVPGFNQQLRCYASWTGHHDAFSSSCAMVAMYYGKVENDDAYNLVRRSMAKY